MAFKFKKTKNIINDTMSIFINSVMNKFTEKWEKENENLAYILPFAIYFLGDSLLKNIKTVNTEYIMTNQLEKAIRNFTKNSKIDLLKDNSKYIQEEEKLFEIEAEAELLEIEAEEEQEQEETEIEAEEYSGDNVYIETYDNL